MTLFRGENVKDPERDLIVSRDNGRPAGGKWLELGTLGLSSFSGIIEEAYISEYTWPQCIPLYDRLWRADPEVAIARLIFDAMSREQNIKFDLHPSVEKPTPADEEAVEFGNQVLEDIEGGIDRWYNKAMSTVPFYGWGWWEVVPGLRKEGWRPPSRGKMPDPWRSNYNDELVGYRRLAFRRYASFYDWDLDEETGRLGGWWQHDLPNEPVLLPIDRSLHITFGDSDNPEGLAVFEAMARLERVKFALEVILGVGFERSAGYVEFTSEEQLTDADIANIRKAARAVMSAQEGNYLAIPGKIKGEIMDVAFQAAGELLNSVRYYGILKLGLLGMQWAALGTLSPYGSYSSMADASAFYLSIYNSISEGFIKQADTQIGERLFDYEVNKQAFAGMTRRPVLTVTQAEKMVNLQELAQFVNSIAMYLPLGDDDYLAIRRKSGFLPEVLPLDAELPEDESESAPGDESTAEDSVDADGSPSEGKTTSDDSGVDDEPEEDADMSRRPFTIPDDEYPTTTEHGGWVSERDIASAVRRFTKWAKENDPELLALLNAKPIFPPEETEVP